MRQPRTWLIKQLRKPLLMLEYFRALAKEFLNILFGETLLGILFLIWWALGAPTNHALIVVFVVAMFVAGYYAWRAGHIRLEKRIEISQVTTQEWKVPSGSAGGGNLARAWYLAVVNLSEGLTIEDVNVELQRIEPEAPNLNWLPVPLHIKHDDPSRPEDYRKNFNLNPLQIMNVDFVSASEGDNRFSIIHTVAHANRLVHFDTEGHRLQVTINAKDMPLLSRWFKVWRGDDGFIQCEMEK